MRETTVAPITMKYLLAVTGKVSCDPPQILPRILQPSLCWRHEAASGIVFAVRGFRQMRGESNRLCPPQCRNGALSQCCVYDSDAYLYFILYVVIAIDD